MDADEFLSVFSGRVDVIGRSQGMSVKVNDGELKEFVGDHLAGKERIGFYNHLDGDVVRFSVIDFDSHGYADESCKTEMNTLSSKCQEYLNRAGLNCYREISKSGPGNYHIWIFFDEPIEAAFIRRVLRSFMDAVIIPGAKAQKVEIFPKQDHLNGGIGNFIWLPLFPPDAKRGRTIFIDTESRPIDPDFKPNSRGSINELVDLFNLDGDNAPAFRNEGSTSRVMWINQVLAGVEQGRRNENAAKLAGFFNAKNIPEDVALTLMAHWNERNSPPLPAREVERTVRSIFRYKQETSTDSSTLQCLRGGEIYSMEIPNVCDLLKRIVRAKSLTFLAGEEGCGKSIFVMNLALAVAVGAKKFLSWEIERPGRVLFLNNELYLEDFALRFKKMSEHLPARGDLNNFLAPPHVPSIDECWDDLNRICSSEAPALLVLDCLYFAHNEDENDSSRMKILMRRLQKLRDDHSLCVLVVHHLRKGTRNERMHNDLLRGAGVFGAVADTVLLLKRSQRNESMRLLKPTKLRHSADENRGARLLSLDPSSLWFHDEGEVNEDDHLLQLDEQRTAEEEIDFKEIFDGQGELSRKEIIERCAPLGYDERTIDRLLRQAKTAGILISQRYGRYELRRNA